MSNEEDDENYSDYNDDSFDNESIEEISENESLSSSQTTEDILPEVTDAKSLKWADVRKKLSDFMERKNEGSTGSLDKLSSDEEEEENDLSNLNLEEDDNAISQLLKKAAESQSKINVNEHEIDESDTDNENESEIVEDMKSLNIENKKENNIESESIPLIIEPTNEQCNDDSNDSCLTMLNQSQIEFDVRSETPSSFNSDEHAFHVEILKEQERYIASKRQIEKKSRNSNRKSLSFSNERMREIERHNQILLRKILTQKPRKEAFSNSSGRASSSAVNRKKQQRQIDIDNQVLKKKLEAIASRRKSAFQ